MPARTGQDYIASLREQPLAVWICGERVEDVTSHPALRNGVRSVAALYDMQYDPDLKEEMTYISPSSGAVQSLRGNGSPCRARDWCRPGAQRRAGAGDARPARRGDRHLFAADEADEGGGGTPLCPGLRHSLRHAGSEVLVPREL
jgi:4-hydroxyphenylacetate 3-hydroxylase N terminal